MKVELWDMESKNNLINFAKSLIGGAGFILWISFGFDYRIIALSLGIVCFLQTIQLHINGISSKVKPVFMQKKN